MAASLPRSSPVSIPQRKGDPLVVDRDEHPRETSVEALAKLKPIVRPDGTVTAGNASGVNDGAAAMIVASEEAAKRNGLTPRARIVGAAVAGVPPRIMGIGPAPASQKLLQRLGLKIGDIDVIELNEAFAAQALAVLRQLGLPDDAEHVNPNGGAIALGHPLGMSGARLALTAAEELQRTRRPACARHHVHRRRPGNRHGARAGLGAVDPPRIAAAAGIMGVDVGYGRIGEETLDHRFSLAPIDEVAIDHHPRLVERPERQRPRRAHRQRDVVDESGRRDVKGRSLGT